MSKRNDGKAIAKVLRVLEPLRNRSRRTVLRAVAAALGQYQIGARPPEPTIMLEPTAAKKGK